MRLVDRLSRSVGVAAVVLLMAAPLQAQQLVDLTVGVRSLNAGFDGRRGGIFGGSQVPAGVPGAQFDLYCFDDIRTVNPPATYEYYRFTFAEAVANLTTGSGLFAGLSNASQWRGLGFLADQYIGPESDFNDEVQEALWARAKGIGSADAGVTALIADALNPVLTAPYDNFVVFIGKSVWEQFRDHGTVQVGGNQSFIAFTGEPSIVTPEPGTYALMAFGLAAMGAYSRRRKHTS